MEVWDLESGVWSRHTGGDINLGGESAFLANRCTRSDLHQVGKMRPTEGIKTTERYTDMLKK